MAAPLSNLANSLDLFRTSKRCNPWTTLGPYVTGPCPTMRRPRTAAVRAQNTNAVLLRTPKSGDRTVAIGPPLSPTVASNPCWPYENYWEEEPTCTGWIDPDSVSNDQRQHLRWDRIGRRIVISSPDSKGIRHARYIETAAWIRARRREMERSSERCTTYQELRQSQRKRPAEDVVLEAQANTINLLRRGQLVQHEEEQKANRKRQRQQEKVDMIRSRSVCQRQKAATQPAACPVPPSSQKNLDSFWVTTVISSVRAAGPPSTTIAAPAFPPLGDSSLARRNPRWTLDIPSSIPDSPPRITIPSDNDSETDE